MTCLQVSTTTGTTANINLEEFVPRVHGMTYDRQLVSRYPVQNDDF